jgi:hypothetical protein
VAVRGSHSQDLTVPEAFAAAVAQRASAALSKRATRRDLFHVGDVAFEIEAPADDAHGWLGRAFLPGAGPPAKTTASPHRLFTWDGTETDTLPPPRPWPPKAIEPRGVVESHSNEAVRCAVDMDTNSLIVYSFAENLSHIWFPNISEMPLVAKTSPFRIQLSWLCNLHRMQLVHGAAVAIGGRAVLLTGKGGSGKSTTALGCALAGMQYLGDDYCVVEPSAGKVHMLYRTAKLLKKTLDIMPCPGVVENPDRLDIEKGVVFLEPSDVHLLRSAALSAILLPRVEPDAPTRLYPATREEAIKAILPSTIGQLMGGTSASPGLIMALVRNAPAFHLTLGGDRKSVTDTIASRLMAG